MPAGKAGSWRRTMPCVLPRADMAGTSSGGGEGRDSAHLRQSALRLGLASPMAQPRGADLSKAAGAAPLHARWRAWRRRCGARWMRGARRARTIAIAFRWVWPCWSRDGSRPAQLRAALAAQRTAGGGRLGEWLVRQRSSSEEQVTRALGLQWGCPVLNMEFHNPEDLTALLPRLFIDAFGALPLRVAAGKILYLGFEDRIDPALALATERMTGLHVEAGLVQGFSLPARARARPGGTVSARRAYRGSYGAGIGLGADQGSRGGAPRGGASGAHSRLLLAAHLAPAPDRAPAGLRLHSRPDCFDRHALRLVLLEFRGGTSMPTGGCSAVRESGTHGSKPERR